MTQPRLELDDLTAMNGKQLIWLLRHGHPLDLDAMAGHQYLGTDLSMPAIGHKVLWETFRKTFVRDDVHGDVRGWNVALEQRGIHGEQIAKRRKDGSLVSYAHYRVRTGDGAKRWPRRLVPQAYFDYTIAGNNFIEGAACTPVVSVNDDGAELILGWEVFNVAGRLIGPPLFWAIRRDGLVDEIVEPSRPPKL